MTTFWGLGLKLIANPAVRPSGLLLTRSVWTVLSIYPNCFNRKKIERLFLHMHNQLATTYMYNGRGEPFLYATGVHIFLIANKRYVYHLKQIVCSYYGVGQYGKLKVISCIFFVPRNLMLRQIRHKKRDSAIQRAHVTKVFIIV